MRVPWPRPVWSAAFAIVITLVVTRGDVDATSLPAFFLSTLIAYLGWPAVAARLPPGYALTVTPAGVATVVLFGLAYAVLPTVQSGAPLAVSAMAPRLVAAALVVLAFSVVFSVLGAIRWAGR